MSGLEVLERVRATLASDELPVIMTTAKTESQDVVEALSKGANDYVTKPIDFAVLAARIKKLLRGRTPVLEAPATAGLLGGTYRLGEVIGRGGFGAVFRARDVRLERDVAVKMLLGVATKNSTAIERFQREAVTSCRIKHPNAVTVLDFNVAPDGSAYLVMELLRGKPLSDLLEGEKRLPPERCAELLLPVCDVLAQVHAAGLVHRDIKPANIFLETVDGRECVKVVDFGVAKLMDEAGTGWEGLTVPGAIVGTPAYMAPERFDAESRVGPPSDVYALGVMLYEMIEGKMPFAPASGDLVSLVMMHSEAPPPQLDPALSDPSQKLGPLVRDAMAKRPEDRPTAAQFAERLRAATSGG